MRLITTKRKIPTNNMKIINKYELKIINRVQTLDLSSHSSLLKIAEQDGKLMLWVQECTDCHAESWTFRIFRTGDKIDFNVDMAFIETVLMSNDLECHVFVENDGDIMEIHDIPRSNKDN